MNVRPTGDVQTFLTQALAIDPAAETDRIVTALRGQLRGMRKRGLVLGLSGGIDSSVSVALAARAIGRQNVLCLFMPESDSDPESLRLGRLVADTFGVEAIVEDIGPTLRAMGCYHRRDAFIRGLVPEYGEGWASKIVIANALEGEGYNISSLVVQDPEGKQTKLRMPLPVYLGIVAATNMKQRTRKQIEYYHADRLNFAVLGTPNRLEYDQGFFVKNGDGAADVKPIAHLYKTQVYALAAYLGVPEEIRSRPPTTDTYSLAQTQEEFYFSLSYDRMDLCLYGLNNGVAAEVVGQAAGLAASQIERVWADIAAKRKATRYLHLRPQLVDEVEEIGT
ncbi:MULTISPECIES: NAD(+) synthase [unclassified Mesorhizobium]|uniref:NAD(+) synthase n=1 Tax=unclassified Mesorhizobium TaxID=325217 RepID=UPI000FDBDA31|nr:MULTISPECIES: NAD(+) synthase [unclassified Mesorhizobium]TGQ42050.1 NAD(+) synthase [Mesorhizobium sp. M00.F.Ca.ET.216.01.1.1]TIS55084.1 MAG: NAD(+) synthase [Mesorhizobium sp.]TIS92924.1 MAG: NAD(+) synthase [Mesorhizobium sp.]TJW14892.1 MAG: NAD(+) synthase [Mesorhizobium sp.]TJW48948.1 MAG: NAD(+) synthase [Mesorhizobium sp.]